jgi:uncharacterized protein YuzE
MEIGKNGKITGIAVLHEGTVLKGVMCNKM